MTSAQRSVLLSQILALFADRPSQRPAEWCCQNLRFDEPDNRGPFTTSGREYIAEPLDSYGDPLVTDLVMVFGTQTGKTGVVMGGAAWTIVNEPVRIVWVMPTMDTVKKFARTRWLPFIKASQVLRDLVPQGGNRRHDFTSYCQTIGNSIVDMLWSNSPAALSSVPARMVNLDEVDKFAEGGKKEADAVTLAEQRAKNFANPKRIKCSSPTLIDGLIWQEFLKTDQRRWFLPCPHCGKFVVLVWSKEFTVFPITGCEAFVRWDNEAKRDGRWDLDRVTASARYECPHCGGHINDGHRSVMNRVGEWRPTASSASGYRGYHLPSLCSSSVQSSVGALARKFLQAKQSLTGLQGFINGELAEPWENQDTRDERVELVAPAGAVPIEGATVLLTADYQFTTPHVWYVARSWKQDSRLVECGSLDTLVELRAKQLALGVADRHVGIDSGHAAQDIYSACLQFGKGVVRPDGRSLFVGWTPMKGFDRREKWKHPKTGLPRPWCLSSAALPNQRLRLPLLEFSTDHLKDMLDRLRKGQTPHKWEVTDKADATYWKHMDAEIKRPVYHPRTKRVIYEWQRRSRFWPDHLRDCEIEQVALALLHGLLPWNETK